MLRTGKRVHEALHSEQGFCKQQQFPGLIWKVSERYCLPADVLGFCFFPGGQEGPTRQWHGGCFELLLQKQLKGKQMQKEMSEFIRER